MKKLLWKIILIITFCTTITPPASSQQAFRGWLNFRGSSSETLKEGETTSETTTFFQNNTLNYTNFITPRLSYQLNLRTSYRDSDTTNAEGIEDSTHFRAVRPTIDLSLTNPMYSFNAGYRRDEKWSTARITNESRDTSENYYSRFNLFPEFLPTLSLQFNREENFDHLSEKKKDDTSTRYLASSAYDLPSRDIKLSFGATYSHSETETPLRVTEKSEIDNFNSNFKVAFVRSFWRNRTNVSLDYQNNYTWGESRLFVTETGDVLFRRAPFGGLYAQGTTLQPDVDVLDPIGWSGLVDEDFNTGLDINVGTEELHNIGIRVSSEKPVDRLYIYVNEDVCTDDTNLKNRDNWEVYWSDFNQPGTWTEVPIDEILCKAFDIEEDIYLYEIVFSEPQNASLFKAVTLDTVNALGVTDVLVTEIEAYGIDTVPETGELTDETKLLNQRINLNTSVVPLRKISFSLNYSIDKSEEDFDSFFDALSGIFEDIINKSRDGGDSESTSFTRRTYGASAKWLTHELLTTSLSFQRYESFDNQKISDITTDSYLLSLNSNPLPALVANLILTKIENKKFDEKSSESESVFLSMDAKLYREVNMTTDASYTQSENFATEADTDEGKSETISINGTIDARLRKNLFANLRYNFQWLSSEEKSTSLQAGSSRITYRPGRFTNITADFSISSSEGDTSTSERISIDWRPLPAIRTSISYQHTHTEPGPLKTDKFNSHGVWEITKFMTADFNYTYTKQKQNTESEQHNFIAELNCRF
jgi:hypothetical protein